MASDDGDLIYCNGLVSDAPKSARTAKPGPHAGAHHCSRPAGWGTDHAGRGRCKLHGGCAGRPSQHALYSEIREDLREYVEQATEMDAPGDLQGELAVLRALLLDYLDGANDLDRDDVEAAHKLLKEIRRTSDTIHKQLQRERLTKEEEQKLFTTFAKILREYVPDADRDSALDELEAIAAGGGRRALESEF